MLCSTEKENRILLWAQTAAILGWMLILERPELKVYSSYDYLLCGGAGLYCLWKNHGALSRKNLVLPVIFALSTLLANYFWFVPMRRLSSILQMGIVALGGFLVCSHILRWAQTHAAKPTAAPGKRPVRVFLLSMVGILAVYWVYLFFCVYPGCYDLDTEWAFNDIRRGVYGFRIPVYYTLFIQGCLNIGYMLGKTGNDALAVYSLVQTTAMAACFAYMLVTLYERNVPVRWLLTLGVLYAFVPCYLGASVSIWKDTPFSLAAAFLCIALYRMYERVGNTAGNYIVYGLSSVAFCLSRTNGWYSFLALTALLLLVGSLRNWKLLGISAVILLATWVMLNPVLERFGARGTDYLEVLSTPLQQISRVCWSDYDPPAEDIELLEKVLDTEQVADLYQYNLVDPIKYDCFRRDNMAYFLEHFGEYARLWLRWGIRYPGDYLKAWVDLTKGFWSIGRDYYNFYCLDREYLPMGFAQVDFSNPVADRLALLFYRSEQSMLLRPFFSCGLQLWLVLGCMLLQRKSGRKGWVAGLPALIILVGLWLCTPTSGPFRYAYVTAFVAPFMICDTAFRG